MSTMPGPHGTAALRAARGILDEPTPTVLALADEHGRTFGIHAGPLQIAIVGDRLLVKELLTGPQHRYRWGPVFRIPLGVFVGATSMLVSDGEDHDRRRRLVQPGFALRRLQMWRAAILNEIDRMIDALPMDTPVDLASHIQTTVRRIVVRILFGPELDADEIGQRLAPAAAYVNRPALRQPPHPFPWGARERARRSRRSFDEALDAEIDRRTGRAAGDRDDVLDQLLATPGLSRPELRDQVVSLIGAGYDTTTATASWMLLRAAPDRAVWARLRDEAGRVGPDAERPYAAAVVHESLRIHPAGAFAPRLVARSFDLGPYRLRRGTLVAWSPLLVGRDPETWPDPMRFDPTRHIGAEEPEYAWVPFGAGSRSCLGFGLARMNLTLLASRLAARLDLDVLTDHVPEPVGVVTAHPRGGVPVRVRARR